MKYSRQVEIFRQARTRHIGFLSSVLWKLTGDRELFTEAMQYALLGMWRNVEKLDGEKAGAYIYRIALTANSKAWRNRIGKDGQIGEEQIIAEQTPQREIADVELAEKVRQAVSQLPTKQAKAIVMRYLEQRDYKDVAKKLNCSEAGARSNVSKAIATLKKRLANSSEGGQ
jgi:RNA polymerase sigma factor (sigma-70 family)